MYRNGVYPITIAEMEVFVRDAERLLSEEELNNLKDLLAFDPFGGEVIVGTDGVRELLHYPDPANTARQVRVFYYFRDLNMPLYALSVCDAEEELQIDEETKKEIRELVAEILSAKSRLASDIPGRTA